MNARTPARPTAGKTSASLRFSGINALLVGAGLVSVALGFYMLSEGSTVAAPLLLVLGYAVLIPVGIIK